HRGEASTAPTSVRATAMQEERDVGPELSRDRTEVDVESVHRFERAQSGGRVRTGPTHARAGWDSFVQMNARRQRAIGGVLEGLLRVQDRVVFLADSQPRRGDGGFLRGLEHEEVVQRDCLEGRVQLVESVRVAPDDLEVEVQLRARGKRGDQSGIGFKPARYLTARSW